MGVEAYKKVFLFGTRPQKEMFEKQNLISVADPGGGAIESLYKESSAMRGLKVWKQNGVQILSIEKTQVLTMHE